LLYKLSSFLVISSLYRVFCFGFLAILKSVLKHEQDVNYRVVFIFRLAYSNQVYNCSVVLRRLANSLEHIAFIYMYYYLQIWLCKYPTDKIILLYYRISGVCK